MVDEPGADVGNGVEKGGKTVGQARCGETWMRWNDFYDSQLLQQSSNILSHVHTREIACVARVTCARCGVLSQELEFAVNVFEAYLSFQALHHL